MLKNQIKEFDELLADISTYVSPTLTITVQSLRDSDVAVKAGNRLKEYKDAIEKKRKELVGPLNDEVKRINDYARTIAEPLNTAQDHLRREILKFETKQAAIRAELQKKLEEEKAQALKKLEEEAEADAEAESFAVGLFGSDEASESPEPSQSAEVKRAVLEAEFQGKAWDINDGRVKNTRKTWKFEVTDAALLPSEFLMPNEKAIRAAVTNGRTNIPGVRTWQEANISFGQKTSVSRAAIAKENADG